MARLRLRNLLSVLLFKPHLLEWPHSWRVVAARSRLFQWLSSRFKSQDSQAGCTLQDHRVIITWRTWSWLITQSYLCRFVCLLKCLFRFQKCKKQVFLAVCRSMSWLLASFLYLSIYLQVCLSTYLSMSLTVFPSSILIRFPAASDDQRENSFIERES